MPFPRAFYRAVANLSRPHAKGEDNAAQPVDAELVDYHAAADRLSARPEAEVSAAHLVELDLADLDFDRPEQALEALRRVVAEARKGEQLVLLRTAPDMAGKTFRRKSKTAPKSEMAGM